MQGPGNGLQAVTDDAPQGLGLPQTVQGYAPPRLPGSVVGLEAALRALDAVRLALFGYSVGGLPQVVDLMDLDADNLRFCEETLGIGEVSIVVTGKRPAGIDETRLAGVWRVRETDAEGAPRRDVLEVADLPGLVRFGAFTGARTLLDLPTTVPEGVMNAPGVLAELRARVAARSRASANTASINLTLLPLTPEDLALLERHLGTGPVCVHSRGYGDCTLQATTVRHVWWARYRNVEGREIMSTLEVTDQPVAAVA